jgi:hypothetical protein
MVAICAAIACTSDDSRNQTADGSAGTDSGAATDGPIVGPGTGLGDGGAAGTLTGSGGAGGTVTGTGGAAGMAIGIGGAGGLGTGGTALGVGGTTQGVGGGAGTLPPTGAGGI